MNNLSKISPIQNVEDKLAVGVNGEYTAGWKLILPEVFTLKDEEVNNIYRHLMGIIKDLPKHTIVHFQNFFIEDVFRNKQTNNLWTQKMDINYLDGRTINLHYVNLYVTFPKNSGPKSFNSFLNPHNYLFKPFKTNANDKAAAVAFADTFDNELNSSTLFAAKRMDDENLLTAFFDYYNQSYDKPAAYLDNLMVDPYKVEEDFLKIGQNYVGAVSLKNEGPTLTVRKNHDGINLDEYYTDKHVNTKFDIPTNLTYPIGLALPFNHILNLVIEVLDLETIQPKVKKGSLGLSVMETFSKGGKAYEKKQAVNQYLKELGQGNDKPALVSLNVIVHDSNKNLLKKKLSIVKQAMRNMNSSTGFIENLMTGEVFFGSFPGNGRISPRFLFSTVENACFYIHYETHYKSSKNGFPWIDRFGNPILIDLRNFPGKDNNNVLVFGPSGSGKSHFAQGYIDRALNVDEHVLLVNIKPDYVHSGMLNGCFYVNTADKNNVGINPFADVNTNQYGKYTPDEMDVNLLRTLIFDCWFENDNQIDHNLRAIIGEYIFAYFNDVNESPGIIPTFTGFYDFADVFFNLLNKEEQKYFDITSFKLVLKEFAHGPLKHILNTKREFNIFEKKYVVFDLMGIKSDKRLMKIYLNYLANLGYKKMMNTFSKGIFTNLIFDEAIEVMVGKSADFIGSMFATIRSLNGGITLITQGVKYYDGVDKTVREKIFTNTQTFVLLDHSRNTNLIPGVVNYCSLSDQDERLLRDIKSQKGLYKEFFLKLGEKSLLLRNEVSPETNIAYSTSSKEVKAIQKELEYANGNMIIAIKNYINSNHD